MHAPNPRVRVLERTLSPSPDPSAYWPMESSDTDTSPRGRRETPCVIHGWGTCPYPIASRQMDLSSPSPREGGEGVAAVEEDDEEDPIEIILVLDCPPKPAPRQMARIQVGGQGRPTGTLAPRSGVKEPKEGSPVTRSMVWPLPPPLPQQESIATTTPSPLLSHVGGRILRRFTHLAIPSCPGHRLGAWDFLGWP
jgi:hypothetical protein